MKIKAIGHITIQWFLPAIFLLNLTTFQTPVFSQLADGQDKYLGCIIKSEPDVPDNFADYWNQVTPENASKWGSVEGTRDTYNWNYLDLAYDYALDHGFTFRFHVLIWGKQQPVWIDALDPAEQMEEVEEWMAEVASQYPDLEYLEVVNEAVISSYDPYPSYYQALGGEGETGYDWVIWAFERAREYFPDAKLYLNEYNVLSGGKLTNYLKVVNLLKERELIDGVCEQGHYFALKYTSINTLRNNLDKLAATGLPICISEFEIDEADDAVQLQKYQTYFPMFWEHPSVEGITLWGYIENKLWKPNGYLVRADGSERPALQWLRDYISGTLSVETSAPATFQLSQNHPNPFNPSTMIHYSLTLPSSVQLTVINVQGQTVKILVNEFHGAGDYSVIWDGLDDQNHRVPSGIYFYRLKSDNTSQQKKMLLIR